MAMKCSICNHLERSSIDKAILAGQSNRSIAAQYKVSQTAVQRHKANHIPGHLAEAKLAETVTQADDLLAQTRSLLDQAQSITDEARAAGDLRTAITGIGKIKDILELLMKVTWELTKAAEAKETGPKGGPIKFIEISLQGKHDDD